MHPDSVGEIIHRACNVEQSVPDLSLGNQFANTINPRSPCRSSPVLAWQELAPVSHLLEERHRLLNSRVCQGHLPFTEGEQP
jgi:hypothetical protein